MVDVAGIVCPDHYRQSYSRLWVRTAGVTLSPLPAAFPGVRGFWMQYALRRPHLPGRENKRKVCGGGLGGPKGLWEKEGVVLLSDVVLHISINDLQMQSVQCSLSNSIKTVLTRYPCCGGNAMRSGTMQLYSPGCCPADHQVRSEGRSTSSFKGRRGPNRPVHNAITHSCTIITTHC